MRVAGFSSNRAIRAFWLDRRISALLGSVVKARRREMACRDSGRGERGGGEEEEEEEEDEEEERRRRRREGRKEGRYEGMLKKHHLNYKCQITGVAYPWYP